MAGLAARLAAGLAAGLADGLADGQETHGGDVLKLHSARYGLRAAVALAAASLASGAAGAECHVAVTFTNSGDEALTLLPRHAVTRTPLGQWRHLWPDAEPVIVEAGGVHVRDWRHRRCQPEDRRAFEFHVERGDCRPAGMATPEDPILPGREEDIDPDRIITVRWPEDGFRQLQPGGAPAGAPIQPSGDGGLAQNDGRMRLEAPDLAAACAAAREG